jgi:hypothetical protein
MSRDDMFGALFVGGVFLFCLVASFLWLRRRFARANMSGDF